MPNSGVYQPEPVALPNVDVPPVSIAEPPQVQAQSAAQAPPVRPSGFTGGGGQSLNIVDNFLRGMMAGKQMREQKEIASRANEIKAHTFTANTMKETAQQAADDVRRLQGTGAPADAIAAAQQKAQDAHAAYTQEWGQLSDAYGRHLGVVDDAKPKGVGGKIKRGAQEAFLPQMAAALAPQAIQSMKNAPPPLRQPSEEELLRTDTMRKQGKAAQVALDEATQRQADEAELRKFSINPPAVGTPEAQRYDFLRQMSRLPTMAEEAAKNRDIDEKTKQYAFNDQTRQTVKDAQAAQTAGKPLSPVQIGALKSVGMWQEKNVLDYYTDEVGKKFKNPMDAIHSFLRDQAQFSRAPSMFHEIVNAEIEMETLGNNGKLTPAGKQAAIDRAIRTFRPQQSIAEGREEFRWQDAVSKQEKILTDQQKQLSRGEIASGKKLTPQQIREQAEKMVGAKPSSGGSSPSPVNVPSGASSGTNPKVELLLNKYGIK